MKKEFPCLGFGGAAVSGEGGGYGFGAINAEQSISLLRDCFDRGIWLYDTAPIYGFGTSEERIGEAFKSMREKVFIVSKSGISWHDNGRVNMSNDPKITQTMIEESLKRLKSEYIDLYMIHWPDANVDIRRPMEILFKAQQQGKILSIGLCNSNFDDLERAQEVAPISYLQSQVNLFERSEIEFLKASKKKGIKLMSWGTLDKGILTKTVDEKRTFDEFDCRKSAPWWKAIDKQPRYKKVKKLSEEICSKEVELLDLALAFNKHQGIDVLLCGGKSVSQWEGLINSFNKNIPSEMVEQADFICRD